MDTSQVFLELMHHELPSAVADITGNIYHPSIRGQARFYATPQSGVLIEIEVIGLPDDPIVPTSFYAMHIHEYGDCSGDFSNAGNIYDPPNLQHPFHSGDLPPLMSYGGYSWMAFYDDRLTIHNIIGKAIMIHDTKGLPTSQLQEGDRIACGVILPIR